MWNYWFPNCTKAPSSSFPEIVSPHVIRGVRILPLHSHLVAPVAYYSNKARQLWNVVKGCKRRLKGTNSHLHTNSLLSYQHVFHTTTVIHLMYIFKCVSGALWPVLCWRSVPPTKAKTNCVIWTWGAGCHRSSIVISALSKKYVEIYIESNYIQ